MDLTQYIDLDSYSSSPGFLGYTDNIPDFSEAGINALCDRFLEKMAAHIGDVTVISSLFINSNKEELSQDYDIPLTDIDKFLHALLKNGLVKTIDLDTLPDSDSPLFDQECGRLSLSKLTFSFYFQASSVTSVLKSRLRFQSLRRDGRFDGRAENTRCQAKAILHWRRLRTATDNYGLVRTPRFEPLPIEQRL